MAPPENPSALSKTINAASRDLHENVNKLVMARIALGLRDIRLFREGILSFFYIYQTFETEWLRLISPTSPLPPRKLHILRTIYHPVLLRTDALLNDLAFYYDLPSPTAAAEAFSSTPTASGRKAYIEHIRSAIEKEPLVIISYAHLMYMALFAGGKVIKSRMVTVTGFFPKKNGLSREECQRRGTNLFTFEGAEKGREDEEVRGGFKKRLASVEGEMTEEEKMAIVDEAKEIFRQNKLLIYELDKLKPPPEPTASRFNSLLFTSMMLMLVITLTVRITNKIWPEAMGSYLAIVEDWSERIFRLQERGVDTSKLGCEGEL